MNVLALNSSPRTGDVSKTEIMLDCLVEGMRNAEAQVDVVNLRKKKIKYCIGCFTCWTKTPGQCIHQDDMTRELFPKFRNSDLVVLAMPLYHYTVNAQMKTFIERTLPIALPFFELRAGVTRHPMRHEPPPVVVLSVAGFPELSVFDQLSSYFRYLFGDRLLAEIYRTSCELLKRGSSHKKIQDIYDGTVQGGRELIQTKGISPETMARITQPLTDFEKMAPLGNLMWETCIKEGVTLGEFQKNNMVPRPNSIEAFLAVMRYGFNPEKAGDHQLCIQFDFSGQVEGSCHLTVRNGEISTELGPAENPEAIIRTPFELWMDILTRKADGQEVFMQNKFTVEGDLSALLRMHEFFGDQETKI